MYAADSVNILLKFSHLRPLLAGDIYKMDTPELFGCSARLIKEKEVMLILTRRVGETLIIGDDVTVTVLGVKGNQVRIGVNAPKDVFELELLDEPVQNFEGWGHPIP